eukprot:TRINITY_DN22804_c0_g1_i1.p1 TRINITY_DN22804_c0_g1~~TRINITY_DN22804_c0_g1_i1.p1  ORF type:complete len:406 (-),score=102.61 TRINITY_DN22804_c0_g1_i1:39-1256(-)
MLTNGQLLFVCLSLPFAIVSQIFVKKPQLTSSLVASLILSTAAAWFTSYVIPVISKYTLKAGLKGRDINKAVNAAESAAHGKIAAAANNADPKIKYIPESLGLASGIVFLLAVSVSQVLFATSVDQRALYNAALHSICLMMFLGFADDVLDIPWRYKILLPFMATIPLVVAYSGGTGISLPAILKGNLKYLYIELGIVYKIFMTLIAVFCTNSINILAGINGLEAGQSLIIALAIVVHNSIEVIANPVGSSQFQSHWFSLLLMLPFIGTTLGLLHWNWYPSEVFVGDTFTLYSGMTLAVAGILGHFSKTLVLFFLPQGLNFLYSLPQLIGWVPITRHRLPMFKPEDGKLYGVRSHMNLVNLTLLILGPMTERQLCIVLLSFQSLCCAIGFFLRYYVSSFFYANGK